MSLEKLFSNRLFFLTVATAWAVGVVVNWRVS